MPTTISKKYDDLLKAFPDVADHLFNSNGELNAFGKIADELLGLRECYNKGLLLAGSGVTERPIHVINIRVKEEISSDALVARAVEEVRNNKNKEMGVIIITPMLE